jgi:hypothetical protein
LAGIVQSISISKSRLDLDRLNLWFLGINRRVEFSSIHLAESFSADEAVFKVANYQVLRWAVYFDTVVGDVPK